MKSFLLILLFVSPALAVSEMGAYPAGLPPAVTEPGVRNGPFTPPQESPQVRTVQKAGTVIAVDTVFQRLTVREEDGSVREFPLQTTTPLVQNFAQIGFQDLHPGDRVIVNYNVEPLWVNRVEKQ